MSSGIGCRSSATNDETNDGEEGRISQSGVRNWCGSVRSSAQVEWQREWCEAREGGLRVLELPMHYRLKFIDSFEDTVRALNIEAADDDSAIYYSSTQSIYFNMPVELWCEDNFCRACA